MECSFGKVMDVIQSCQTNAQLVVANQYLLRAMKMDCISYYSAIEAWRCINDKWAESNDLPRIPPPKPSYRHGMVTT